MEDYTSFKLLGGTRDDAAGEAFDKVGRKIGLPYPAGAEMDKLAHLGNPRAYPLPRCAINSDQVEFSFSGLKTAAINLIHTAEQKDESINREDLAASLTASICHGIYTKTDLALKTTAKTAKKLVLAGGVAANTHLRAALEALAEKRNIPFVVPERALCGDNGAMIAAAGYYDYLAGHRADTSLNASALDDEEM